jgi:hypothetical protein
MTIRLNGSTSGYVEIDAAAVAGAGVLTLPTGTGTLLTAEGGKVLQIVRATNTTNMATTSLSFVDVTGMSVTITPQKNTSAILIISTFYGIVLRSSGTGCRATYAITDSSNNTLSGGGEYTLGSYRYSYGASALHDGPVTLIGYATPATTSAVTYKLRLKAGESGNEANISGSATSVSQLYAIEVSA